MEMEDRARWRQKPSSEENVLSFNDSEPFLSREWSSGIPQIKESSSETTANPSRYYHNYFSVLVYICLALFAWIITCILSFRPIVAPTYTADTTRASLYSSMAGLYQRNQRWLQATRVIQSIVSVLSIPLTSAVCAEAAVAFTQRSSSRTSLSLRQTMALADKAWASPFMVLRAIKPQNFKRIGSSFLLVAIFMNLLGLIVTPLQEIFLTQRAILVPNLVSRIHHQNDLLDLFGRNDTSSQNSDSVPLLRRMLESVSSADLQLHLWTNLTVEACAEPLSGQDVLTLADTLADYGSICGVSASLEFLALEYRHTHGRVSYDGVDPWQNLTALQHPFLAQLPNNFTTGVLQQFIPRINTSATYDSIGESDFPSDCGTYPGSFYAEYSGTSDGWDVTVCMPGDQRSSPWKATHLRQDFSESLFLKINGQCFKATVNTTAGYFELPSYANHQQFSDILDRDPIELCGASCPPEGGTVAEDNLKGANPREEVLYDGPIIPLPVGPPPSEIQNLELVRNKGPLLTTALALFGNNSFLAQRTSHPEAFTKTNNAESTCIDTLPLGKLAQLPCINSTQDASSQISSWLRLFTEVDADGDTSARPRTSILLNQAAFLSNEILLTWQNSTSRYPQSYMTISYDHGTNTLVPKISDTGIIVVSIVLAAQLLGLSILVVYACWTGLWTNSLDAFTMLRFGAAVGENRLPLWLAKDIDNLAVLHQLPGWVGHASRSETVGQLALGSPDKIRSGMSYRSYEEG
ncbi:hypothetical protein LTR64_008648 [Lithohypha guttulata]|uniref:uncharacterized protein n=1 Tax=Lithohypha guttulata TaxID=1690604 RepID=UPI002DE11A28|nr:hypothetical protein LTR51_008745 [Lithohypha guttulata]